MREMKKLLNTKQYNELKDFISTTPLHKWDALSFVCELAKHGNKEMFQYYIDNVQWQDRRFNRNTLFEYNCGNILNNACKSGNIEFIKYLLELDVFKEGDKAFDDATVIQYGVPHHGILTHVFDFFAARLEGIKYVDFVHSVRSVNHDVGDFVIVKHIDDKYFNLSNFTLYGALSIQCMKQYNSPKTQEYNKYKSFVVVVEPLHKKYKSMITPGLELAIGFAETLFALNTPTVLPYEVQSIVLELMLQQRDCAANRCRGYVDKEFSFAEYNTKRLLTEMALTAEEMTGKKINEIVKF